MKWLVVVACARANFLSDPESFLREPDARVQPQWACAMVDAADKSEAFDRGSDAWGNGDFVGFQPSEYELLNWYVARVDAAHRQKTTPVSQRL
jgi:hypothetical protein